MRTHIVTVGIAYDSTGGIWETMDVTVEESGTQEKEQIEEQAIEVAMKHLSLPENRHLHVAHVWIHHFNECEYEEG